MDTNICSSLWLQDSQRNWTCRWGQGMSDCLHTAQTDLSSYDCRTGCQWTWRACRRQCWLCHTPWTEVWDILSVSTIIVLDIFYLALCNRNRTQAVADFMGLCLSLLYRILASNVLGSGDLFNPEFYSAASCMFYRRWGRWIAVKSCALWMRLCTFVGGIWTHRWCSAPMECCCGSLHRTTAWLMWHTSSLMRSTSATNLLISC